MIRIIRRTNKDKDFYTLMGPFLARREIEKEIGYKIYDDDEKVWLIAKEGKEVQGFCYLLEKPKGKYQIGSCYVVAEYRCKGIFKDLLNEALKGLKGTVIMTTKNKYLREVLLDNGFIPAKERGSYTEYVKECDADVI